MEKNNNMNNNDNQSESNVSIQEILTHMEHLHYQNEELKRVIINQEFLLMELLERSERYHAMMKERYDTLERLIMDNHRKQLSQLSEHFQ